MLQPKILLQPFASGPLGFWRLFPDNVIGPYSAPYKNWSFETDKFAVFHTLQLINVEEGVKCKWYRYDGSSYFLISEAPFVSAFDMQQQPNVNYSFHRYKCSYTLDNGTTGDLYASIEVIYTVKIAVDEIITKSPVTLKIYSDFSKLMPVREVQVSAASKEVPILINDFDNGYWLESDTNDTFGRKLHEVNCMIWC